MEPEVLQWIPVLQIVSNAVLAIVAICVAAASLVVAYRNNFGWKPIILVTSRGLRGEASDNRNFSASVAYEVWNRRKYPIILRYAEVRFDGLELDSRRQLDDDDKIKWHFVGGERLISRNSETVAPTSHMSFEVSVPFRASSLDALNAEIRIKLRYFDPRKNSAFTLEVTEPYKFT